MFYPEIYNTQVQILKRIKGSTSVLIIISYYFQTYLKIDKSQAAVVHFNFRAGLTFPVPVCTVPHGHWINKADNLNSTSRCNTVDAVRLYATYRCRFTFTTGAEVREVDIFSSIS